MIPFVLRLSKHERIFLTTGVLVVNYPEPSCRGVEV